MAPVSQWAGIESGAAAPSASPRPGSGAGANAAMGAPQRPAPRLRRTERLVLGSIDGAAHVMQQHSRAVLVGSALFLVPMVAFNLLLTVLAYNDFDAVDGVLGSRGYVGVESGFTLLALATQSFSAHIVGAYTAVYLVRFQMGGAPTIRIALAAVLRKLPVLVVTWLVTHWWALLFHWWFVTADTDGTVLFVLVALLVAPLLSAMVLFTTPVLMAERLGVKSVARAWRLAKPRFAAAWGFVVACAVLAFLLFVFIAWLPTLAEATGLITFGSYRWLVQGVAAQVALLVVVPFVAIATAQLYLQVRVHAEGLDLVMAADRAFPASA